MLVPLRPVSPDTEVRSTDDSPRPFMNLYATSMRETGPFATPTILWHAAGHAAPTRDWMMTQ